LTCVRMLLVPLSPSFLVPDGQEVTFLK
jgi:hypothetical protein